MACSTPAPRQLRGCARAPRLRLPNQTTRKDRRVRMEFLSGTGLPRSSRVSAPLSPPGLRRPEWKCQTRLSQAQHQSETPPVRETRIIYLFVCLRPDKTGHARARNCTRCCLCSEAFFSNSVRGTGYRRDVAMSTSSCSWMIVADRD